MAGDVNDPLHGATEDARVLAAANPAAARAAIPVAPPLRDRRLWFAVLAPPLAWSVDTLASVALHLDYCAARAGTSVRPFGGVAVLLATIGVIALATSAAGGLTAWRAAASSGARADAPVTGRGDTTRDRRRFMAAVAMVACALFSYAIVLRLITAAFVSPSWCGA